MQKHFSKTFFLAILFFGFFGLAQNTLADTHTSATCSLADVNTAIAAATEGDIVQVANNSCDWGSSGITLTKFITLSGGTGTITTTGTMILFDPATPANNGTFRLTGFTANAGVFVKMDTGTSDGVVKMSNIRVDHNTVTTSAEFLYVTHANFFGVVDHNTATIGSGNRLYGPSCAGWLTNIYTFGNADNIYIEDNEFTFTSDFIVAGGFGGRYAFRYNTIHFNLDDMFFSFDIHGNQGLDHTCGAKGGEVYGNVIDNPYNNSIQLMDHRDGRLLLFYNQLATTGGTAIKSRNECNDDQNPSGYTVDNSGMPMHLNDSYYFNDRNSSGVHTSYGGGNVSNSSTQDCEQGAYTIAENQDFWGYKSDFNGTVGVGCGALASRPTTCTTGVGYWATNQSCTDLTGMVGTSPAAPISGTLYKCTATDTWTLYYTPYTYPHPLRGEGGDTTPPVAPSGLSVS